MAVLKITKPPGQIGINVSVSNIIYDGPTVLADSCIFGGLSVFFKNNNTEHLQEMLLECEDEWNKGRRQGFHLFSSINTEYIFLSTMSYHVYSHLEGKVRLTNISCFGVHLLPVTYRNCQRTASSTLPSVYKRASEMFTYQPQHSLNITKGLLKTHLTYENISWSR